MGWLVIIYISVLCTIGIIIYFLTNTKHDNNSKISIKKYEINITSYNQEHDYIKIINKDKSGIGISNVIYYNFPENKYFGWIDLKVEHMNIEQLDETIKQLKEWGKKEEIKLARIKAYENLDI